MADRLELKEYPKEFRDWLEEIFPDDAGAVRRILKKQMAENRLFIDWYTAKTMPDLGYPEMSVSQYGNRLLEYLAMLKEAGLIKGNMADEIYTTAIRQVTLEGVNPRLPLYENIITYSMTPEWQREAKTGKAMEEREWGMGKIAEQKHIKDVLRSQAIEGFEQARYRDWAGGEVKRRAMADVQAELGRTATPARSYEQYKQARLSEQFSPRDWIDRWMLEHGENPYAMPPEEMAIQRKGQLRDIAGEASETMTDLQRGGVTPDEMGRMEKARKALLSAEQELLSLEQGAGWHREEPTGLTPSAPKGLAQLVPGLKAGERIKKVPTSTPSAQAWMRASPTTKQQYAGYVDWLGGESVEDKIARMKAMLPTGRGYKARGWRPFKQ